MKGAGLGHSVFLWGFQGLQALPPGRVHGANTPRADPSLTAHRHAEPLTQARNLTHSLGAPGRKSPSARPASRSPISGRGPAPPSHVPAQDGCARATRVKVAGSLRAERGRCQPCGLQGEREVPRPGRKGRTCLGVSTAGAGSRGWVGPGGGESALRRLPSFPTFGGKTLCLKEARRKTNKQKHPEKPALDFVPGLPPCIGYPGPAFLRACLRAAPGDVRWPAGCSGDKR